MALSNYERVGKGLEALKRGLGPYVLRELKPHYGDRLETVLTNVLYKKQLARFHQGGGTDEAFLEAVDSAALLKIMRDYYRQVFFDKLGHDARNYVHEATSIRNDYAHERPFTTESSARSLETMMLLLRAVSAEEEAEEVGRHLHAVRHDDQRDPVSPESVSGEVTEIPTGNVTFLFTDIEGSTAMHDNYPDQMNAALVRHDEILSSNIEANGGYVFNRGGDAFCAAFHTARDALHAVLAAQRTLVAEEWPENVEVRVRMGLHTGVTEEGDGDYFGSEVNRVARVMSAGHGGQVLFSSVAYGMVRDHLAHLEPEAELRNLGEHRLKDLKHTEHIYQLVVPDLPEDFPELKTHGLVYPSEIINLDRRYRQVKWIGGGGFGEVYLVHHEALDRDMALKVLGRQYANDEQVVERFRREAKSAAKLNHPNIVAVHDAGVGILDKQEASYMAMEYVPGGTLKDYIRRNGWLSAKAAAEVAAQIGGALGAAHQQGVIHRDIKPQNVLLTETGGVKVADFGIARAASDPTITHTSQVLGSAPYLSPEQAIGAPTGPQSDLYSLGVVLYEMLTGELPYDVDTPPREINPEIPEGVNALTAKLLSKRPEERHHSAAELLDDLEKITDGKDPATAVTEPLPDRNNEETERAQPTLAEIVVSPDPGEHFQSIGQALREVRSGGRIRVRPGVYRESLVIDKPVEIVGEQEQDWDVAVESAEGPCLSISAEGGTLRGLVLRRLEDTGEQDEEYRAAVTVSAGQVKIEDCDIISLVGDCIIVHGSETNPTIRDCEIHDSEGNGISVIDNGGGVVEDCDIFGNAGAGVTINTGANPTIQNCKIYDGQISGVYVHDEGKGLLEDCNIFGNGTVGLALDNGGNLSDGISISTKGSPVIRGCHVHGSKGAGVWVFQDGAGTVGSAPCNRG